MKIIDNSGGYGGYLSRAEIDTAHFKGNFPESCELRAINSPDLVPANYQEMAGASEGCSWATVLPRTKLGPHRRHFFQLDNVDHTKYTHVMLTIYPDGGVKRVRVIGTQAIGTSPESRALSLNTGGMPATNSAEGEFGRGGDGFYCILTPSSRRWGCGDW